MGGFDKLSKLDLAGSAVFIQSLFKKTKCPSNVALGSSLFLSLFPTPSHSHKKKKKKIVELVSAV